MPNEQSAPTSAVNFELSGSRKVFEEWLARQPNFFKTPAVAPGHTDQSGYGLYAAEPIAENATVVSIPRDMMINSTNIIKNNPAYQTPYFRTKRALHFLVPFVLIEKSRGKNSPWACYLDIFPNDMDDKPLVSYTKVHNKNAPPVAKHFTKLVANTQETMIQDQKLMHRNAPQALACLIRDAQKFLWAYSSVLTRFAAFSDSGCGHDAADICCLVPFFDLLNHAIAPNIKIVFDDKLGIKIVTTKPIAAGQELTISYSSNDNAVFLLYHGFVLSRPIEIDHQHHHHHQMLIIPSSKDCVSLKLKDMFTALDIEDEELTLLQPTKYFGKSSTNLCLQITWPEAYIDQQIVIEIVDPNQMKIVQQPAFVPKDYNEYISMVLACYQLKDIHQEPSLHSRERLELIADYVAKANSRQRQLYFEDWCTLLGFLLKNVYDCQVSCMVDGEEQNCIAIVNVDKPLEEHLAPVLMPAVKQLLSHEIVLLIVMLANFSVQASIEKHHNVTVK